MLLPPGAVTALAVEDRPADVIAQALVVDYELADRVGQLGALPLTLTSPGTFRLAGGHGGPDGPDGVGGGTEVVRGDMGNGSCLAGGVGGVAG